MIHRHQIRIERAREIQQRPQQPQVHLLPMRACSRNIAPRASSKYPPATANTPGSRAFHQLSGTHQYLVVLNLQRRLLRIDALLQLPHAGESQQQHQQ